MALNLSEGELLQNRYRLMSPLGKGGFSVVWLVEDTYTGSEVALKIFAPDKGLDESGLTQFQKEYTRTRGLRHPHLLVPDHFDILQEVNAPYLVMPYCPNGSLHERFSGGSGSVTEADLATIMSQIGSGLAELHKNRIIHQDIKPDNVLISSKGQYMLTDFGISRQMRSTLNKATANQSYMTVAYSPPERYSADPVNTPASDIFSIGVMIYELCSGSVPWDGVGGMVLNTGAAVPNLPEQYSGRLNELVKACMAREYADRPTADQLAEFGQTFLSERYWPEWSAGKQEVGDTAEEPGSGRKTRKMEQVETEVPPADPPAVPPEGERDRTRKDGGKKMPPRSRRHGGGWIWAAAVVVLLLSVSGYLLFSSAGGTDLPEEDSEITVASDTAGTGVPAALGDSTGDSSDPIVEKKSNDPVTDDPVTEDPDPKQDPDPADTAPAGEGAYHTALDYYRQSRHSQAINLFSSSAQQGYVPSLFFRGRMSHYGEGTTQIYSDALRYYNRAIQEGDRKGYFGLALLYLEGNGVPEDESTAIDYFARSFEAVKEKAEQGEYFWEFALGYLLENGYGTEQDYSAAVDWYRRSAYQEYTEGLYRFGDMFYHGYGVVESHDTAESWFLRATEQGHHFAKVHLGDIYRLRNDYQEAMTWYRRAGEEGDADAQNRVGLMYDLGQGVPENDAMAVEWYRMAAEQGLAVAQSNLGNMYRSGSGVTENDATAVEWYRMSAEQNYATGQNYLGLMYQLGEGVEQDYALAVEWYRKAANNGLAVGQYNLGNMYKDGKGVTQSYSTAYEWYRKAADQKYAGAVNQLGLLYSAGNGVEEDDAEAVRLYKMAADLGLPVGYYNVGVMYQYGNGVTESIAEARRWYKLAEEAGYSGATEKLDEIGR